jgi:hypothetical protein
MKWVAATLALLSLGLWMWILWYADTPVEEAAPPPRAELAPQKMRLLTEPGVRLVPRTPPPAAPGPESAAKAAEPAALACFRLGPFANIEAADQAMTRLSNLKITAERQPEERRTVTGFRVYLPPFPSRQAAEEKRRELTRLGFRDHAVISEEGMPNALSLGVYSIEVNAQRHLARLATKGIKAELQPLHQVRVVYLLEIRAPVEGVEALKKIDWGSPEIALVDESCPQAPAAPATAPAEQEAAE